MGLTIVPVAKTSAKSAKIIDNSDRDCNIIKSIKSLSIESAVNNDSVTIPQWRVKAIGNIKIIFVRKNLTCSRTIIIETN